MKVRPVRVVALQQIDFPIALPLFELLFTAKCVRGRVGRLEPNKPIVLILPNPSRKIGSRTDSVRLAGKEMDVEHRAERPAGVPTFVGMVVLVERSYQQARYMTARA